MPEKYKRVYANDKKKERLIDAIIENVPGLLKEDVMINFLKKVWGSLDDFVTSGVDNILCVSDEGRFAKHCFHTKMIKVESCLKGVPEVKKVCCRCGVIRNW